MFCVLKYRKFMNRGMLKWPTLYCIWHCSSNYNNWLPELFDEILILFLGCAGVSTLLEWFTAKILEKLDHKKWWDYSSKRWNLDGYICLQYSIVWGILGVLSVKFVTPVLMKLYHMVPSFMMQITLWALLGVLIVDILGSTYIIRGSVKRNDTIQKIDHELYSRKKRFGRWLEKHILMRVEKAYPAINEGECREGKITVLLKAVPLQACIIVFIVHGSMI